MSAKKMSHRWLLRRRPVTEVVSRRDFRIVHPLYSQTREKSKNGFRSIQNHYFKLRVTPLFARV